MLTNFLDTTFGGVVLPVNVKEIFGNAFNLGLLIASALLVLCPESSPLQILLAAVFLTRIGAGPLNPISGAIEFERIPTNMRGRVFGAITAGAWTAMPLGMLLGGIFTETFGTQAMLIFLGTAYLLVTVSMAFIPTMKEMNRKV